MTLYLTFMGDSLTTSAPNYGLTAADEHPYRTVQLLRIAHPEMTIIGRALGIGGQTTGQMVGRKAAMTQFEVPRIAVLYGGANDAGVATTINGSGATTTSIPVQTGAGVNFIIGSWLLIGGESRKIASVATDTLTLATALSTAPANGAAVTIDTRGNLVELGRALITAGCTRIAVHGSHMKNWATGGDTLTTEEAVYGALRPLQAGAASDLLLLGADALYIDNLASMRAMIVSGAETIGSNCWAAYANNQHLNCTRSRGDVAGRRGGHDVLAANAVAAMLVKRGWIED